MHARPYHPEDYQPSLPETPPEHGPVWIVEEDDRKVAHQITLAEVLGIEMPDGDTEDRRVARLHLRTLLFETLRESMPAEALLDEDHGNPWAAFDRNARFASFAFARLRDRPSHEWSPGFTPVELAINWTLRAAHTYRERHGRSGTARWWAILITELEKALTLSRDRLSGRSDMAPGGVWSFKDLRWHLYPGGPKVGFAGYIEHVGEGAPEGPERVAWWLAADGEILEPEAPGVPPGGPAPPGTDASPEPTPANA